MVGGLIPVVIFDSARAQLHVQNSSGHYWLRYHAGNNLGLIIGPHRRRHCAHSLAMVSALVTAIAIAAALAGAHSSTADNKLESAA
ncbi:hypothetical protein F2981_33815 (plasmid) [Sinorhizobium meliloti]|nr:hypothetical protein [Sinorhizobium meliloti]